MCWPLATWYISWHTAICFSVVSLPSCLFKLQCGQFPHISLHFRFLNAYLVGSVVDVADYKTQGPDWKRLSILFLWYLMGIPIAYTMQNSCSVGAPGTWARAGRVFIEGVVAFGLGGFIYVGIKVSRWRFIILRLNRGWADVCSRVTIHPGYYCHMHLKRCHSLSQGTSSPVGPRSRYKELPSYNYRNQRSSISSKRNQCSFLSIPLCQYRQSRVTQGILPHPNTDQRRSQVRSSSESRVSPLQRRIDRTQIKSSIYYMCAVGLH